MGTWAAVPRVVLCLATLLSTGAAIDCYKCTSINGDNNQCEDKFPIDQRTYHLIARDCQYGYFSGTHCIKLSGTRADGTKILVRHCSDSDWGKTCGDIRWVLAETGDEERITGCLTACNYDGCNTAPPRLAAPSVLLAALLTLTWRLLL